MSVTVRVAGLLAQVVLVAALGAGVVLDAYLIALILPAVLAVPVVSALEQQLTAAVAGARPGELRSLWRAALRRALLIGAPLAGLAVLLAPVAVWLSAPGAGDEVHRQALDAAWFVYAGIAARVVAGAGAGFLYGTRRFLWPAAVQVCNPLCTAVAVLAFGADLVALAIAALLGDVLVAAASVLGAARVARRDEQACSSPSAPRTRDGRRSPPPTASDPRRALRGLGALAMTFGVGRLVTTVDQAVVAGLGAGSLSRFALATRLFDVVLAAMVLPAARLAQVAVASASARAERGESVVSEVAVVARRAARRSVAFGAGAWVGVSVLAVVGLPVAFGRGSFTADDVRATVGIALALAPSAVPMAYEISVFRTLVALGRARALIGVKALHVALNLVLDVILAALWGAIGVAVATTVSYVVIGWVEHALVARAVLGAAGRPPSSAPTSPSPTVRVPALDAP